MLGGGVAMIHNNPPPQSPPFAPSPLLLPDVSTEAGVRKLLVLANKTNNEEWSPCTLSYGKKTEECARTEPGGGVGVAVLLAVAQKKERGVEVGAGGERDGRG